MKNIYILFAVVFVCLVAMLPTAQAAQTATLSWVPPTERADGSALALSSVTGYTIYSAIGGDGSAGNLTKFAQIIPGSSYVATLNLSPSPDPVTVYFAITAWSVNGESEYSEIGSKTFNVSSTAPPNVPTQLQIEITGDAGATVTVVQ